MPEYRGLNLSTAVTTLMLFFFVFSLLAIAGCGTVNEGTPVEPVVAETDEDEESFFLRGRFALVNAELNIFDLSQDREGNAFLFGSSAKTVNLLDREGKLCWEMNLEGLPYFTKMTADGRFIVIGASDGTLAFLAYDGESGTGKPIWEKNLGAEISQLMVSDKGEHLLVGLMNEEERSTLCFFNTKGELLWEKEVGDLLKIDLGSAGNRIYYSELTPDGPVLIRLNVNGEVVWEKPGLTLAAFSREGEDLAAVRENEIVYLNSDGAERWSRRIEISPTHVEMSMDGRYLAAYSQFGCGEDNFFLYNREGDRLWKKRIPDGSLFTIAAGGERIISSSWQEYSDDLSEVKVFNAEGEEEKNLEIVSRIEKLSLTENGRYLSLAGRDGNIYIFDLLAPREQEEGLETVLYRPVTAERIPSQMKITLYFYDHEAMHLIPVTRSVKQTQSVLKTAFEELIRGPLRHSGLLRTIPKETEIGISINKGTAYIDLPKELCQLGGSTRCSGILNSLLYTASQFPTIESIQFLVEGKPAEVFGEGIDISQPFPIASLGQSGQGNLFLPYFSGERYYLLPQEASSLGLEIRDPRHLVETLLQQSGTFFPPKLEPRQVILNDKHIVVDFNKAFLTLFPENGDHEIQARATLLLDALVYTLVENFPPDTVIITVEGKQTVLPEGYPPLEYTVERPFSLNPES